MYTNQRTAVDGVAEGKLCSSSSQLFRGPCIIDKNCQTTCEREGFEDGKCEGILLQCICYKTCDKSPPPTN